MMTRSEPARRAIALIVAVAGAALFAGSAYAAPFCLLRKPDAPSTDPRCFEFYLADTAVSPPRTMATSAGACTVTPYAAGQGWSVDPTFPDALPGAAAGDAAMSVVSRYFQNAYGCGTGDGVASGNAGNTGGGMPICGTVCQTTSIINQPEARDAAGKIAVEAATIYVMQCPGTPDPVYLYAYVNRPGYRAIHPGNWSQPIGGQDFSTCDAAENAVIAENGGGATTTPGSGTGTAQSSAEAELNWNQDGDAFRVVGSKGTLTGNLEAWHFSGPANVNGTPTGTNVVCDGHLTAAAPGEGAEGRMTCDVAWGNPETKWHCEGLGAQRVVWSLGDYWFGMWPNACVGTITRDGKTEPNQFGLLGLKSGLGLN